MSLPQNEKINCPKCGRSISVTTFQSINTKYSKDVAQKIISGDLFDVKCPKCGFVTHLKYDMLYSDIKHDAMIWLIYRDAPDYQQRVEEVRKTNIIPNITTRIVSDSKSLREKAACLERNRDDRIVELCKVFAVYNLLDQKPEFKCTEAFYTIIEGREMILFYDENKNSTSCELSAEMYDLFYKKYFNSSFAKEFDSNYPIIDYAWAEKMHMKLAGVLKDNVDSDSVDTNEDSNDEVEFIDHEVSILDANEVEDILSKLMIDKKTSGHPKEGSKKMAESKRLNKKNLLKMLCAILGIAVVALTVALIITIGSHQSTYTVTYYNNKGISFYYNYSNSSSNTVERVNVKYQDETVYKIRKNIEKYPSEPPPPTNEGYVFLGWYLDPECTEKFIFGYYEIHSDINLYAKWGETRS